MAQIPSAKALTEGDGQTDFFNVNTLNQRLELPNGSALVQYADNYVTPGLQLKGGTIATLTNAAVAIATGNTIATANIGKSVVNPAAAVTGIILQAGTFDGQEVWVVNKAAAANTVTFNTTPATANVADSATEPAIAGLTARKFVWDATSALWYRTA